MAADPHDGHRSPTVSSVLGTLGGLGSAAAVVTQVRWVPAIAFVILGCALVSLAVGSIVTRALLGTARRPNRLKTTVGVSAVSALAFGLVVLIGGVASLPPATSQSPPVAETPTAIPNNPEVSPAVAVPAPSAPPSPKTTGEGSVLAQYTVDISDGYAINFAAGAAPQPFQPSSGDGADLMYYCCSLLRTGGKLALADAPTTYAACKADTRYTDRIGDAAPGMSVCFTGHSMVAGIQITQTGNTGSGRYLTLAVTVWRSG